MIESRLVCIEVVWELEGIQRDLVFGIDLGSGARFDSDSDSGADLTMFIHLYNTVSLCTNQNTI